MNLVKLSNKLLVTASVALWLVAIGAGLGIIWNYQNSPGAEGTPPTEWPISSQLQPVVGRPTLVMFAHPKCPCSRASIGELERLVSKCQGRVAVYVLFLRPQGFAEGWERTDLWESAARIPDVTVISDPGGVEAKRFNSETSGMSVLYDAARHLIFAGGITASRGHAGDNEGLRAVIDLLSGEVNSEPRSTVYGCPLFNERAASKPGGEVCSK